MEYYVLCGFKETHFYGSKFVVGRYIKPATHASWMGASINMEKPETLISALTDNSRAPTIVFDHFLSGFRTEAFARSYVSTALKDAAFSCLIIESAENKNAIARLHRIARSLDLHLEQDLLNSKNQIVIYSARMRVEDGGFCAVRLADQTRILEDACGLTSAKSLSARQIIELAFEHVSDMKPFSFIRFNHCEPRVAGLSYLFTTADGLETTRLQWGIEISESELDDLSKSLRAAVQGATLLGIPDINRQAGNRNGILENSCYVQFRDFGLLRANTIVTHVNTHLALGRMMEFYEFLKKPEYLTLITGRDVVSRLKDKIGRTKLEQILIPSEYRHTPEGVNEKHYPHVFNRIVTRLKLEVKPGSLYLVGGGILGKIYCDIIRGAGGVALDLGSLFDAWAGKNTRGSGFTSDMAL